MYKEDKQQLFHDAFTEFYEVALEVIYGEYIAICDGDIISPDFEDDAYLAAMNGKVDELAANAKKLRLEIFNTTRTPKTGQ